MATWTSPITWVTGGVTASQFNQQIRDNETWLKGALTQLNVTSDSAKAKITPALVGAKVYKSALQTITSGVDTVLTFDSERFDSDGFHSTSVNTSRITIPAGMDGYYLLGCDVAFAGNATGVRRVAILQNGATELVKVDLHVVSSAGVSVGTPPLFNQCAAADYFEVRVLQSSGGNLDVSALDYSPVFWIARFFST